MEKLTRRVGSALCSAISTRATAPPVARTVPARWVDALRRSPWYMRAMLRRVHAAEYRRRPSRVVGQPKREVTDFSDCASTYSTFWSPQMPTQGGGSSNRPHPTHSQTFLRSIVIDPAWQRLRARGLIRVKGRRIKVHTIYTY